MRTLLVLIATALGWSALMATGSDSVNQGEIPIGENAHCVTARTDFRAGRYDAAAVIYQAMAEAHPDSLFAWSNLGITLFQLNKLKEARDALQHAVDLSPQDGSSLAVLGITEYELGSFPDAITNLKAAVAVNPTDATAHGYLGDSYEAAGFKQEAKAERKTALDLEDAAAEKQEAPAPDVTRTIKLGLDPMGAPGRLSHST